MKHPSTREPEFSQTVGGEPRIRPVLVERHFFGNPHGVDKAVLLDDPGFRVGQCCDHYIDKYVSSCDMTIAAWGNFVSKRKLFWRVEEITDRYENLKVLRITKKGHPHHPLYLPWDLEPVNFAGYRYPASRIERGKEGD